MNILKKFSFAPLFLLSFTLLVHQLLPLFKSYDFIFSLSVDSLIQLITVAALFSVSSLLFSIFVTLAADWKLVLPVAILSALIPMIFLEPALALVFAVAIFISFLLIFLSLETTLKSYLTFKPEVLLSPSIRHLAGLLALSFCLIFFLSTNKIIAQSGFQIPDSLIDTALKMTPLDITAEQDSPTPKAPQNLTQDLIKQTVKDQMQNLLKPYTNFIPAGLAIILFLTLQALTSFINLLIYPLLWITFYILEKTGFVKFEVEQRPVKKLVA